MSASGRTLRQHVIGTFQCPSDRPDVIPHSEEFDTGPRGAAVCNFFGHAGHVGGSPGSMNAPCIHSYYETYRPFAGNGGFSNPDGGRTPNPAGVFARHGVPGDRKGDAATPVRHEICARETSESRENGQSCALSSELP